MLTFEKVLEIFADYLAADETIEVYISRCNSESLGQIQPLHIRDG